MWRFVVALTIAAACGCGKDTKEPTKGATTSAEVGIYALVSLNGSAVPASISEGGTQIAVISGTLTLGAGGTVRISTTFRISPGAAPMTNEVSGNYSMQGNTLTFSYTNGGRNTGTLDGNTLKMLNEGVVWLYQRA
jgi:hypothetical protein